MKLKREYKPVVPPLIQSDETGVTRATKWHALPDQFWLENGECLNRGALAYETWGDPRNAKAGTTLIFSGMSSGCHVSSSSLDPTRGWWEDAVGVGRPLCSSERRVICVSNFGSCFGSAGPASMNPDTGQVFGNTFPAFSIGDQARAVVHFLNEQEITHLDCVIGTSMGGMLALAFAQEYAGHVKNLVIVSSSLRASPHAKIWRTLQIEMITGDRNWNKGPEHLPTAGLQKARQLGLTTYTAASGLEKLGNDVEAFFQRKAWEFANNFNPYAFVKLAQAQNTFSFSGPVKSKLDRALVIGANTDILCPEYQLAELADLLTELGVETRLQILTSTNGHDAFLREQSLFASQINDFLRD